MIQRYEHIPFEDTALPIRVNYDSRLFPGDSAIGMPLSWHEQIELLYFRAGSTLIRCGDRDYIAEAGDIILINPFEIHQVSYHGGEPLYDCLMIDASLYRDARQGICDTRYFDLLSDSHACFENHLQKDSQAIAHMQALCAELKEKAVAYELSVKAHVFGLFVCLFRSHVRSGTIFRQMVDNIERYERIKPVLEYMRENMREPIRLEALAKQCSMSPAHFCRIFRQITGTTPVQYLTSMRLHQAAALLKRTDRSISQIAEEVGFDDVGYLSRCFKKQFGLTPTQLKKQSLAAEGAHSSPVPGTLSLPSVPAAAEDAPLRQLCR